MKPLIIAHRSQTPGAMANARSSLALAAAAGADLIELDVRLSLDRVPVVVHDAMLGRSTVGHGWVGMWPWSALRRLHLRDDSGAGRVPDLRQMLAATPPGVSLALHLKERRALGPVLRQVRAYGDPGSTWFWLEHPADVARATRQLPGSRCTLLRPQGWQPDHLPRYLGDARNSGASAISVPWGVIDRNLISAPHDLGLLVFSRMENEDLLPANIEAGLDGVITSDPARARSIIAAICP
jgi:glycerophosphoryl diester phosphodiesterase